jgi:hypothetical protein
MSLAHADELEALLQQMRSDPVATGIKKHGPVNPQVKKNKGTSGGVSILCFLCVVSIYNLYLCASACATVLTC